MSIRRRAIANKLIHWLGTEPNESEKSRIVREVLNSNSRLSKYISYHVRRLRSG